MLTKLSVKNYKAFDEASVDIKPITILLGANSVGKSSITQLLLMLQQTAKSNLKSYGSALKLYGGFVNLGEPINLFRRKEKNKPITITFELKSRGLYTILKKNQLELLKTQADLLNSIFSKETVDIREKEGMDVRKSVDNFYMTLKKSKRKKEDIHIPFMSHANPRGGAFIVKFNADNKKEILEIIDFWEKLSSVLKNSKFLVSYDIVLDDKNLLRLSRISIQQGNQQLIELNLNSKDLDVVKVGFFNVKEEIIKEIRDLISFSNTIFSFLNEESIANNNTLFSYVDDEFEKRKKEFSQLALLIINTVNQFQRTIKIEFAEELINYVGPLRAHPKRYYMLDKAKVNLTLDTLDGDAVAEVLKEDTNVADSVNKWLKKFGVEVSVTEFKEVIHHLTVKQNDVDLDITDVGFGISQVLPVIIQGFLSPSRSTTIIEQPEIHLHPTVQADLADLFIDIVKNSKDKRLIIETHSEYLLKRLRRRISEGIISANDVSICLFNPGNGESAGSIQNLKIQEKGFFEWPTDFYSGELLKDTTEFLKNQ